MTTVPNTHKVASKTWRKWNAQQRALFNGVYEDIQNVGAKLFVHPVTAQRDLTDEEFDTIAWNAAWTAAHILNGEFTTEVVTLHQGKVIASEAIRQRAA